MADNLTIARPYAKAVFEHALASHAQLYALDGWEKLLQQLSLAVKNPSLSTLLDNPKVSDQQFHDLLMEVLQKSFPDFFATNQKTISNFLNLLILEKRLNILPQISLRYQSLLTAERQLKEVTVTSAFPLDQGRRQTLTEALTKYLNSKLAVTFQEDASLIGGVIVRSGNWVMDNSIRGRLQDLKTALQNSSG